jgi:hypothetical protein
MSINTINTFRQEDLDHLFNAAFSSKGGAVTSNFTLFHDWKSGTQSNSKTSKEQNFLNSSNVSSLGQNNT